MKEKLIRIYSAFRRKNKGRFTIPRVVLHNLRLLLIPSSRSFCRLKNKHKGENCYIIATGPSLTIADLEMLKQKNAVCISVNKIFKVFDKTGWRPDYYVISDGGLVKDNSFFEGLPLDHNNFPNIIYSRFFINRPRKDAIPYKQNITTNLLYASRYPSLRKKYFGCRYSRNANYGIYNGKSVIHTAIQLAGYMGFKNCFLLGTDCGTQGNQTYMKEISAPIENDDLARKNAIYNDLIEDYNNLDSDMKKKKIAMRIYNASRGGRLEVFPWISLEDSFLL